MIKSNLPLLPQQYAFMLVVFFVSIILFFCEPHSSITLQYELSAINRGEWYRLFTAHFLHTNVLHLAFNLIGFALLWALHGDDYSILNSILLFIFLCFFVSISLYFFTPEISVYVGLSGVLHGVFCWGVVQDISKKMKTGYLLLLGIVLKLGSEQINGAGSLMPALIEADVAIDSHLYGAMWGVVAGLFTLFVKKHKKTP